MTDPRTERQRDPIPSVEPAEMDGFGRRELEAMAAAGARVLECQRALATAGTSVVFADDFECMDAMLSTGAIMLRKPQHNLGHFLSCFISKKKIYKDRCCFKIVSI